MKAILLIFLAISANATPVPKNIIFFVVDGMGDAQIEATRIYLGNKKLAFEEFAHKGSVTTCSVEGLGLDGKCDPASPIVTDSAAAATAMATGKKVKRGVVSKQIPGDGSDLPNILERAKKLGKSTGIVTNTLITDATPAGFGGHANDRDDQKDILRTITTETTPNVIFGGDLPEYEKVVKSSAAKYQVIKTADQLRAFAKQKKSACKGDACSHVYGGFGMYSLMPDILPVYWDGSLPLEAKGPKYFAEKNLPHLSEMAQVAIDALSQNQNGFVLLIESGLPDWIGHINRHFGKNGLPSAVKAVIDEMVETNRTVEIAAKWARGRKDTLVLLTADHETGGLKLLKEKTKCIGKKDCVVETEWTSHTSLEEGLEYSRHTGGPVPIYATGPNAHLFAQKIDNTEILSKILP